MVSRPWWQANTISEHVCGSLNSSIRTYNSIRHKLGYFSVPEFLARHDKPGTNGFVYFGLPLWTDRHLLFAQHKSNDKQSLQITICCCQSDWNCQTKYVHNTLTEAHVVAYCWLVIISISAYCLYRLAANDKTNKTKRANIKIYCDTHGVIGKIKKWYCIVYCRGKVSGKQFSFDGIT